MRIALSIDSLTPQLTGIGRYTWELYKQLATSSEIKRLTVFRGDQWVAHPSQLMLPRYGGEARFAKIRRRWRKMQFDLRTTGSLFHGPNYFLPPSIEGGIITVHDLSVFRYAETHPSDRIAEFERRFAHSIGKAAHVITDSEAIRRDLIAYAGLAEHRVTAVPLGISPALRPIPARTLAPRLARLGLPAGGYGLSLSTLEPRKRIDRLLAAWRALPADLRTRFPLIVCGGMGWKSERLADEIAAAQAEGWLHYLGFVPEHDLPVLYAGASLFVFPSVYEGFGLPPLEAMASGVPTIVADCSSLPEVTRGAAMYVNPDDVPGFALAIARGLLDEDWRAGATRSGLDVTAGYSWERCGRETIDVYRRFAD